MFSKKIVKTTALEREQANLLQTARETIARQAAAIEALRHRAGRRGDWARATVSTTVHPVKWPRASVRLNPDVVSLTLTDTGLTVHKAKKPVAPRVPPQAPKPAAAAEAARPPVVVLPSPDLSPMDRVAKKLFQKAFDDLTNKEQKAVRRAMSNGAAH